MRRCTVALSFVLLAALLAACSGSSSATRTATVTAAPATTTFAPVQFGSTQLRIESTSGARAIEVEVATTSEQSERGLGNRDTLAPDAGMMFDLHVTRSISFWMKGMRFALDMVWIGDDKRVVAITADVPPQPDVPDDQLLFYSPGAPVRYVLELNAGAAKRIGIATGAQLSFELP